MRVKSLKLVVFDCDGTLVDSQQAIISAMTESWRAAGLDDPDPREVRRLVALPLTEAIVQLAPGVDAFTVKRLAGLYRAAYYGDRHQDRHDPEPLFPGAREALSVMRAHGWLLGIATGKSKTALHDLLDAYGLRDWFSSLQTSDCCAGKPCPDMVDRARAECGSACADTVMIGDSAYDIEMARAAGVRSIGVSWGYQEVRELLEAGAERIVHSFDEVPRAVLELLGSGALATTLAAPDFGGESLPVVSAKAILAGGER